MDMEIRQRVTRGGYDDDTPLEDLGQVIVKSDGTIRWVYNNATLYQSTLSTLMVGMSYGLHGIAYKHAQGIAPVEVLRQMGFIMHKRVTHNGKDTYEMDRISPDGETVEEITIALNNRKATEADL